jgi:hypothetical protein
VLTAILALIVGVVLGGLAMLLPLRTARAREQALAVAIRKLGHDLRGAVSPAMLMAERLEQNADPAIRQAGTIITQAMDRAADLSKAASALAGKPKPGV